MVEAMSLGEGEGVYVGCCGGVGPRACGIAVGRVGGGCWGRASLWSRGLQGIRVNGERCA